MVNPLMGVSQDIVCDFLWYLNPYMLISIFSIVYNSRLVTGGGGLTLLCCFRVSRDGGGGYFRLVGSRRRGLRVWDLV